MEGKAGTENKHELPPPHDGELLFGDAIVVSTAGDFTAEGWAEFYDKAFGGFEDLGSESGSESESEDGEYEEEEEEGDEAEDEDGSAGEEEDVEEAEDAEDAEEDEGDEEEEEDADDDCCDEGEDGGGAKRRAPRRRAVAAPEYRRLDMGLRARIKLPVPLGKRAPKWHTAAELEPEEYSM
jgi:hypothetical protein